MDQRPIHDASSEEAKQPSVVSGDTGPGTALKDLLPLPSDVAQVAEPDKDNRSRTMTEEPSLSHALAVDEHEERGFAQQPHEDEVKDLGWNEEKENIESPLVGGMDNEDLWLLVRRFNKVCQCQA